MKARLAAGYVWWVFGESVASISKMRVVEKHDRKILEICRVIEIPTESSRRQHKLAVSLHAHGFRAHKRGLTAIFSATD